jgi:hypothetical protein
MGKLKNYIVHCTDTPMGMRVTKDMLDEWHMAPKIIRHGMIKYLGKEYRELNEAPLKDIHKGIWGNGWDRFGYKLIIHRDGTTTILSKVNDDQEISSDEMTWGVAGMNSTSVHVVLEGGWLIDGSKPKNLCNFHDLFTEQQWFVLRGNIVNFIGKHKQVEVSGHNRYSEKLCPGFGVSMMMRDMGLEDFARY